ncbi:hypothetical protein Scep_024440 [Stephania cephalantha]|uniref:Uncharacterized protein n=1 Tax=Stephania cephalantha TaxID=152367 RepID=A0AAP0HYG5_9MAGN
MGYEVDFVPSTPMDTSRAKQRYVELALLIGSHILREVKKDMRITDEGVRELVVNGAKSFGLVP